MRMTMFGTFCACQCFLIKVIAILYICGVGLDLSDVYCTEDTLSQEEAEWCDKFNIRD